MEVNRFAVFSGFATREAGICYMRPSAGVGATTPVNADKLGNAVSLIFVTKILTRVNST